jgi:Transcriptional regulator, AbiEi antitoxin
VDRWILATGDRQHGVITRRELIDAGLDDRAIGRRVRAGRLHRVHRGVYAVGHAR